MAYYEVDFTYKVEEFGSVDLEADDVEQAEEFAAEHIRETYPEAMQVVIEEVKVIR